MTKFLTLLICLLFAVSVSALTTEEIPMSEADLAEDADIVCMERSDYDEFLAYAVNLEQQLSGLMSLYYSCSEEADSITAQCNVLLENYEQEIESYEQEIERLQDEVIERLRDELVM